MEPSSYDRFWTQRINKENALIAQKIAKEGLAHGELIGSSSSLDTQNPGVISFEQAKR